MCWLSIRAGQLRSALGMWLPKCSRGSLVHTQQCKIPDAAEQTGGGGGGAARWKWSRLTGRAILFGVCPQSCQFSSPGQKSFYLLNQMLGRTKCQANFKAGRCAAPQAPITLQQAPAHSAPLQICSLQTPGSPSPHALHFLWRLSDRPSFCPLITQEAGGSKTGLPASEIKVILPCMAAEMLLLVVLISLKRSIKR